MSYSNGRVHRFIKEFGIYGEWILDIFNEVDPLHCFYGDDVSPDEYVGLARRYLNNPKRSLQPDEALDSLNIDWADTSDRNRMIELLSEMEQWDPIFNDRMDND